MKKDVLDNCIKWIKDNRIKDWTKEFLTEKTPDYFWVIPASSTGKYHPDFAQGEGGLVRHTKVAFQIALDQLSESVWEFPEIDKDIMKSAILLHDTRKHGIPKEKYSRADHGVLTCDAIMDECDSGSIRSEIAACIEAHMGQWNKDFKTKKIIAPKPRTEKEFFVHLCDYQASRKWMEAKFDEMKV